MAPPASAAPTAARRPTVLLIALGMVLALLAEACGGTAAGGGGGDGAYAQVVARTQAALGTSMISGAVEGDTLKITLIDGAGSAMAKLFLCSNVKGFLAEAGLAGAKVVVVERSGTQLATEKDCR